MIKLRLKLDTVLKDKGISQTKLSQMIDVRQGTISDMCRNARTEINIPIVEKIARALNISDISELMQFEEVEMDD
ncbi:helix-turn-helix domain-containing protein [Brevibacillus daliensis]|uniref:helix-turn-helix domain-containing protein n=1 Tax=Brevibacillus daliensis TaxID=2892995 RepID=UPI001E566D6A|nr:helix-turn-helix transcriptional regulator [Brevibacillus daliensis]